MQVAYFSAEFGLTDSLRIYSGGLGILAGDHLKAASDLGIPVVGVGLLYRDGYFHQALNAGGWQMEKNPKNDFYQMPGRSVRTDGGKHLTVDVPFADGNVQTRIWSAPIGPVQLYLLDSNLDENSPADRDITARLYGGDEPMRIRQEILLGVGGLRALHAVGVEPNDHHSAFCMTVPALKLSGGANGVSRLHGEVSRRMWQDLWPIFSQHEILIGRITNGVHIHTWTAPEMSDLFERHLGNTWRFVDSEPASWDRIRHIGDRELWHTHQRQRRQLKDFSRVHLQHQMHSQGGTLNKNRAIPCRTGPRGPDRRFRPPLRHLQTRQPAVPQY